jgi:hypothetical protein
MRRTEAGLDGDEGERDIEVFMNCDGDLWFDEADVYQVTEEDVEKWGDESLTPGDIILWLGSDFEYEILPNVMGDFTITSIMVSEKEMEMLEMGWGPCYLADFEERRQDMPASQFLPSKCECKCKCKRCT